MEDTDLKEFRQFEWERWEQGRLTHQGLFYPKVRDIDIILHDLQENPNQSMLVYTFWDWESLNSNEIDQDVSITTRSFGAFADKGLFAELISLAGQQKVYRIIGFKKYGVVIFNRQNQNP